MRIRIGYAHPDRLLSYPDLRYLSGCCLPIRICAVIRGLPPVVRAVSLWCGSSLEHVFPPISHVIPRRLFQLLKQCCCNSNVFAGYSKVTGLNYVRDLWGSMCDRVLQWGRGGWGSKTSGREAGALVFIQNGGADAIASAPPRSLARRGKNQARLPLARASRISVRSLTSSETSAAGASSSAFLRRALRAFMGTTMQK